MTDPMPPDANDLELITAGDNDNQVSALMSLQKGLFVKIYCVANQMKLFNAGGTEVLEGYYSKLALATPGVQGTGVQTMGVPKEDVFLAFHSPLLDPAKPTDLLETPLPMTGAITTPVDLTDFSATTRLQAGFKLTRTVARFDVVNKAADSKLTITDISMGNGRKGTNLFPISAYGDGTDLITYPARTFTGQDNANEGITTGAFYTYPSPTEDNGYIILKGTYQINETETKEVSYQVPFKSVDNGSYLEINPNHRYTLAITAADEYRIDFNITVADWADDGSIDGYKPEEPEEITNTVTIDQALATAYQNGGYDLTQYPPFNSDYGDITGNSNRDYKGTSATCTIGNPYTIKVESTQTPDVIRYNDALDYCKAKGSDWRLPTYIELYGIYTKCKGENTNPTDSEAASTALGEKFINGYYISCSVYNGDKEIRCRLYLSGAVVGQQRTNSSASSYLRCVRTIE